MKKPDTRINVAIFADRPPGAREFALARMSHKSPFVRRVYIFGENAGTRMLRKVKTLQRPDSDETITELYRRLEVNLVIIGPEAALERGLADLFRDKGLDVFGPNKAAALLETSKAWAVEFMNHNGVPTADTGTHHTLSDALGDVFSRKEWPTVVKFSGLAAGKGVKVCATIGAAEQAVRELYAKDFEAEVLLQKFLKDHPDLARSELSVHVLIARDWSYQVLEAIQDYKPALDGDEGSMTGGMGGFAPL